MTFEKGKGKFAALVCSHFFDLRSLLFVLFLAPMSDSKTAMYSTYEEELPGTVIGNLAADLKLTAAAAGGGPSGFRLMQKSNWTLVQVGKSDGQLTVGERIDREQLCQEQEPCLLVFDVVNFSREKFLLIHVEIQVKDINDNAPEFPQPEMAVEISESSPLGTRLPLEPALDADVGANYLQLYHVSANSYFELEVQSRADGVKCAHLVLVQQLDRETEAELNLELSAQDGGRPPRTGRAKLQVRVLDANDNRPAFEQSSFLVELDEDAPLGSVLLQLEAVDPDQGLNGEVLYGFGPAVPADVRRLFRLDAQSGRLTLEGPLDHESRPSFELDVEAQDLGAKPSRSGCKVTVRVLDINDNAPEISITPAASSSSGLAAYITEAAAKGSFVALVSTSDLDSGRNGRVSCTLYGHQDLELRPAYGNCHMIVTAAALDREREAEYNLTLVAEDQGPTPHKTIRLYTIRVGDENDNAPSFSRSEYRVSLLENNQPGAYIATVLARDPDLGHNGRLTYRLLEPASGRLATIDPATGAIYAARSFDRESLREAELRVEASDGGSPPLSSLATVSLRIADRNDNAPLVTQPLPGNGSAVDVIALPGRAPAGYLATRVRARDADQGLNARLSYRIVSGEQAGLFTIRTDTGEIYLGRPLTSATGPLRLIVAVSDSGRPPLSATVTLSFTAAAEPPGGGGLPDPGKRSWDTSIIIIVVLAGGCVALLMAIITIATACGKGKEPGGWVKASASAARGNRDSFPASLGVQRFPGGGVSSMCGSEDKEGAGAAASEAGGETDLSGESRRAAKPECFPTVSAFGNQTPHPIAIWQGKPFALNKSELAHQTQDRYSGKDSGKGDSDFNDSDSDISGIGLNKRSVLSQKHNGLWSCTSECKILGHSDRCWSPSSRGPNTYSSTNSSQHHTILGKSTSLPPDLLRKDTYYQALLPKTAGLQSVYQKIACN
ncbi:protocadherin-8-like [Scyliorhinus torazame]